MICVNINMWITSINKFPSKKLNVEGFPAPKLSIIYFIIPPPKTCSPL